MTEERKLTSDDLRMIQQLRTNGRDEPGSAGRWAGSYTGSTGGAEQGQGGTGQMFSSLNPGLVAQLFAAGKGDPRILKYIQEKLMSGLSRPGVSPMDRFEANKQAAAFNPSGANVSAGAGARSVGGNGSSGALSANRGSGPSRFFMDQYSDKRDAANRQTQMNQDFDQQHRTMQDRMSLLKQIMGGINGGAGRSTTEQIFNNAGGPQVVKLHSTQSLSPQDLLQYLMR